MKFGKYLASQQLELPEYSGHFIDYKALKKLIKQLSGGIDVAFNEPNNQVHVQQKLKENKASFFFRVERELDKVNSFYLEKQANLAINLELLAMKKNELLIKSAQLASISSSNAGSLNFKNSILFLNLYQAFKKIHQDLLRLQQFIELNETGFLKVVKKWDKRSKSHTKELFLQTAVSVQPVFHRNEINELSDMVTQSLFDLESIMDGDYSVLDNYASSGQASGAPHYSESIARDRLGANLEANSGRFAPLEKSSSFTSSDRNSLAGFSTSEIDELYSSFVNIATLNDGDMSVLNRWIEKVQSSSNGSNEDAKYKFSRIFHLAISNLTICDSFLQTFLDLIHYDIAFDFISDDFNNNKSIIQECCLIPPVSTLESSQHVNINNGVKIVNSLDTVEHSRLFIVEHAVKTLEEEALQNVLLHKDFNGRSCLHYAAQNNRADIIEALLPHFPKQHLDDLDNESMSALLLAIKFNHFGIIMSLINNGSNRYPITSESQPQYLPINYACKIGDYKTLEYLLRCNDYNPKLINQQDVEGLFPLHVIARSGNFKLIKLLVQYGAEVNQLDGLNKWPPIFYAALEGHVKTTETLIKFGAKLDLVDEDGYNVLYYCAMEGHIRVLNHILNYKKDLPSGMDTRGLLDSPMDSIPEHSLSNRHKDALNGNPSAKLGEAEDLEDSGDTEKNVDLIPHLQLPPPILPLRRYGHNFLEQKVLIELFFSGDAGSINLFNSDSGLKPGRITITSNNTDIVPRNIILPTTDRKQDVANCVFQTEVDLLNEFRVDFEIFPKFGTRLIAKTTALDFAQLDSSSPEVNCILLPVFDLRLRNIGELKFKYQVIFPFAGTLLETTKYDTYWKSSTSFIKQGGQSKFNGTGGLSPNNFLSPPVNGAKNSTSAVANTKDETNGYNSASGTPSMVSKSMSSFVTATSLSGEYLRIKVCLLSDGTPVVCPHWSIAIAENIELFLPNLTLAQLTSMTTSLFDYDKVMNDLSKMTLKEIAHIKKLLNIIFLPLDVFLNILSVEIRLSIELVFPSLYELNNIPFAGNIQLNLNKFIDLTLNMVFNHVRSLKSHLHLGANRPMIFVSSNSIVCKILNWKQPNFPVFLIMNGIVFKSSKGVFEARTANGLLIEDIEREREAKAEVESGDMNQTLKKKGVGKIELQALANDQELIIRSIKEAVNFTIDNNLIGIIASIHLLDLVPKLIPLIRSRGLLLVASNDSFEMDVESNLSRKELDTYSKTEINGLRFDDILSFKDDSDGM